MSFRGRTVIIDNESFVIEAELVNHFLLTNKRYGSKKMVPDGKVRTKLNKSRKKL